MTSVQSNEKIRELSAQFSTDTLKFHSFPSPRHRSSANIIHQFPASSAWTTAFKMQTLLVRNAAGSIACAWIPNACYALGNIFSGKWYTEQSRGELIVANSMWASITYCGVVFISFLPIMVSFRFVKASDVRPTVWFCLVRLGRATILYFLMVAIVIFTTCSLIAYLAYVEPRSIKYKLDCYAVNFTLAGYFTAITRAVKRIHYDETIQGREKLRQRQQKPRRSEILPLKDTDKALATQYRAPSFWLAYFRNLPLASVPLLASAFVHILSQQHIVDSGNVALSAFAFGGIALKLSVQDLAKYYVFKKRVRSVRVMCLLVGVPTVLIDTQMRIILLGTNSSNIAAMGALGMAVVEIGLRAGKEALILWQIRRRRELLPVENQVTIVPQTSNSSRPSITTGSNDFEVWRRQMHAFHAAETNADMYAEYISIGCSASILFFYGNHPLYSRLRKAGTEQNDMAEWRMGQLRMLGMQIGVEVVVDYLSIVLEMMMGIEFDHVKKLSSFLAAMFMITAVMNINISVCVYLS